LVAEHIELQLLLVEQCVMGVRQVEVRGSNGVVDVLSSARNVGDQVPEIVGTTRLLQVFI
jgi:hypothetical protein